MKVIQVFFDNGDHIVTSINGTIEEIEKYYLGEKFNVGLGPKDNIAVAISIDYLN